MIALQMKKSILMTKSSIINQNLTNAKINFSLLLLVLSLQRLGQNIKGKND
jgi:hypothetical protein